MGRAENDTSAMNDVQNRWFATTLISRLRGFVQGNERSANYPIDIGDDRKWSRHARDAARDDQRLIRDFVQENVAQDVCLICHNGPTDNSPIEQMSCCGALMHVTCADGYFNTEPSGRCPKCRNENPDAQNGYDPHAVQLGDEEVELDLELHGADDDPYILIGNPGNRVAVDNVNGFFTATEVSDPIISAENLINVGPVEYAPDTDDNCVAGNLQNNRCRVNINFALMIAKVCIDSDIVSFGVHTRMSRYVREIFHELNQLEGATMYRDGSTYHHVDLDLYNNDHVLVLRQARTCASLSNISTTFNGGRFPKLAMTDNGDTNPSLFAGSLIVRNQSASPLQLGSIISQIERSHVFSLKTNNVLSNQDSLTRLFENWKVSVMHDIQFQGITGPVLTTMTQLANGAEWLRYDPGLYNEPYSIRLTDQDHRTVQYYNSTSMLILTNSERFRFTSY
ncbi:unnamed protein product [Ectocarpus sp. 13 AM-2016]